MNQVCRKAVSELMRGKYNLTPTDVQFLTKGVCQVSNINKLKLIFLRLNKHTRTGSLSFTYTDRVMQAVRSKNEEKLAIALTNLDWPEVFKNPDLTDDEIDTLEYTSIQETKLVRNALYAAFDEDNLKKPLFPTCDTRKEHSNEGTVYEDCYHVCFQNKIKKDVPTYLSNVVPVTVSTQTEVCYFFEDVLDHLYSVEIEGKEKLSLNKKETKLIRKTLDLEYRVYRLYRTQVSAAF